MKAEAGGRPVPRGSSQTRPFARGRQTTGTKQPPTLRRPGSDPFVPSLRWYPTWEEKVRKSTRGTCARPGLGALVVDTLPGEGRLPKLSQSPQPRHELFIGDLAR